MNKLLIMCVTGYRFETCHCAAATSETQHVGKSGAQQWRHVF